MDLSVLFCVAVIAIAAGVVIFLAGVCILISSYKREDADVKYRAFKVYATGLVIVIIGVFALVANLIYRLLVQ